MPKDRSKTRKNRYRESNQNESLKTKIEQIARRWNKGEEEAIQEMALENKEFDGAFARANISFLGERYGEFFTELRYQAMQVCTDTNIPELPFPGRQEEYIKDLRLFVMPIYGMTREIGECLSDKRAQASLFESLKKEGVIEKDSYMAISSFTIGIMELTIAGPGKIQQVTNCFEKAINEMGSTGSIEKKETHIEEARKLLNGETFEKSKQTKDKPGEETVDTRYIIGARLGISGGKKNEEHDGIDFISHFSPVEMMKIKGEIDEETAARLYQPLQKWIESSEQFTKEYRTTVSEPMDWDEAMCEWTKNNLRAHVDMTKQELGMADERKADLLHVYNEDGKGIISLWLDYDGLIIGPVVTSIATIGFNVNSFMDEISEEFGFEDVVIHENKRDLPKTRPRLATKN